MSDRFEFRLATPDDAPALRALLVSASLPVDDVAVGPQEFVLAHERGALAGCVGLEPCGDDGVLLRSFAVAPALRSHGLGAALFARVLARALARGARTAYALTTTAERFCLAHGFERVERDRVPPGVAATAQFRTLCSATAACFRRRVDTAAVHLPRDVLPLRPDVPGAAMWAVPLARAMLTYYELAPRTRFERHAHPSEQITMVLEGELWFGLEGGREVRVGAGEVIALPADVPHSAWTGEHAARAVDAWSPPRADLLR